MMDAATAASMADPERNRHFRRRWRETQSPLTLFIPKQVDQDLGPIGLALIDAWERSLRVSRVDVEVESTASSVAAPQ